MWLRVESLHSHTRGFTDRSTTPSASQRESMYSTMASWTRPTLRVLVRAMGVSRVPSSWSCRSPAVLPKPLKGQTPAGSLWVKGFWGPGRITVTPVLCVGVSTVA